MKLVAPLLIVLLLVPAPLLAQEPASTPELEFVEKPSTTMCGEPPMKCFDQENFKRYLQMRVQYAWLFDAHMTLWPAIVSELKKSAAASEKAAGVYEEDAVRWETAYSELFPKYEDATTRAAEAEAMSIWGGGLPWLITALVVGLGAGVGLGVYIQSKASE